MSDGLPLSNSNGQRLFLRDGEGPRAASMTQLGSLNARHLNPVLWGVVILIAACGVSVLAIGLTSLTHASVFLQALPFLAVVLCGVVLFLVVEDSLADRDLRRAIETELALSRESLEAEKKRPKQRVV